jgi:P-type conjugative transfer protein TrbJ
MWTKSSRPMSRPKPDALAAAVLVLAMAALPRGALAQLTVFDPANHVENALQTARQLQSLTQQTQMLMNQARQLAASPYSHLPATSQTLRDISRLAGDMRGLASDLAILEGQFETLYPTAVQGVDPRAALDQATARSAAARATAQDLAVVAAELERLSQGRDLRLEGALAASQAADGQTAAIQSSAQMLSVLAEDLASTRTVLLAQSRLMAEQAASRAAERAASAEARRRFYARQPATPAPPSIDPFPNARR